MSFGQRRRKYDPTLSTVAYANLSEKKKRELIRIFSKNMALQLKSHKVHFIRCWFQWNIFQPRILAGKKQDYHFPLDDFVRILNEEGIQIVGVIGNGYYRFLPRGLDIDRPQVYVARLVEASREIIKHYRGKVSMWQIENEPNWWLQHFASDWRRGVIWLEKGIADLILSSLYKAVREEDPSAPIMINLEADTAKVFSKLYSDYCDILGLDFYPNYAKPTPITVAEIGRKAREAKQISGKTVMITETGYPSGPRLFGYSPDRQSLYVRAICEEAYSNDAIRALGLWRFSDGYWLSFPFQENYFGLLDFRGIPKPAWFEYIEQTMDKG
jgi:hypothetical protein